MTDVKENEASTSREKCVPPICDSSLLDENDDEEWRFETDHVALKNNSDYMNLIKTLTILEAQRIQAVKDIETLAKVKEEALQDPMLFVKRLQDGEDVGFPPPIIIAELPDINWNRYESESFKVGRPQTRKGTHQSVAAPGTDAKKNTVEETPGQILVRGRAFDDSKPETFNQLWTFEEQQRLEELLIEFPPEEVEQSRWKKIAAALGNRTAKQVSSRVQKYFKKLQRAGLPVPGRIPRQTNDVRGPRHHHQRFKQLLFRPSTFFPVRPPYMGDYGGMNYTCHSEDAQGDEYEKGCEDYKDDDDSEDETMNIPEKVARANENNTLDLLRRVQLEKKKEGNNPSTKHFGFKCDLCQEEPLVGTRWHCQTCLSSVDFCSECVVSQLDQSNPHPPSHQLVPIVTNIRGKPSVYDQDYAPQSFAVEDAYNYLDPNFMPG